jgi:hypothetical protein
MTVTQVREGSLTPDDYNKGGRFGHIRSFDDLIKMQVDDIQSFADLLRSRKGVESRSAVLHTDRLDIIRGKDFARWYRKNSDLVNLPIKQGVFSMLLARL